VLTMLVAAAKINQSSIVPAFDQTRVPRIIQVLIRVPFGAETMENDPCTVGTARNYTALTDKDSCTELI